MSEPDELLSKADALLARWRTNAPAPSPPADYPVLTEVVVPPAANNLAEIPEFPTDPEIPVLDMVATGSPARIEVPVLESLEAPSLEAGIGASPAGRPVAAPALADSLTRVPAFDAAEGKSLEERIRVRVLEAIEPRLAASLDGPLSERVEVFARELASRLSAAARDEIVALVREAVRTAVAEELASRRDKRP